MTDRPRINLHFPPAVAEVIDRTARERQLTRPAVIRRALGIMQAFDDAQARGYYVGATRERENLDSVIITPL